MYNQVFIEKVKEFIDMYCQEYMKEVEAEYDFHGGQFATIKCEDYFGMKWEIPVRADDYEADAIVICIGDAGTLNCDDGGLYAFLWQEACSRINAKVRHLYG